VREARKVGKAKPPTIPAAQNQRCGGHGAKARLCPPYELQPAVENKASAIGIGVESPPQMCHPMCGGSHMATNLSIDPDLLERALEVSGERTKKAAVTKALQEFIARRRQKRLLELIGKLEWDESYDYKAERGRK
jgi:Arc/MetJ family transcription regulator